MRALVLIGLFAAQFSLAARHHFTLISDVHYDPNYGTPAAFGSASCGLATAPPMGMSGCDSPIGLVESAFNDIAANAPNNSHLIFTGDWLRHDITLAESAETFRNLTRYVKALPHTTIPAPSFAVASLGNNDFIPDYYFNVTDTETSTVGTFGSLLREADLISDSENATFARAAYYARDLPSPNLRFLVLNTLPYSVELDPSIDPSVIPDPVGQFAWMESELADAQAKGISVVLISHIPPTVNGHTTITRHLRSFVQGAYLETMRGIVDKYNGTVVYQFYGHTHQFSLLADSNFTVPGIIIPSITKIFGNTASYLMAEYDDVAKTFSNFRMRHLDSDAHTWSDYSGGQGEQYLDEEIGPMSTMAEARSTALSLLTDKALWDRYKVVHAGGVYANMWSPLNDDSTAVRVGQVCSMLAFANDDYTACVAKHSNDPTTTPSPNDENDKSLPKGYIALIVIGGIVGIGALGFMFVYAKKNFNTGAPAAELGEGAEPLNTDA